MRVLRANEYRRMPWKNGGGETREILVSPPGATLDTLDWRVSLATVASDGPFSVFTAIDRTLSVIRGAGIRLQVGTEPTALLLENSDPYSFDGEAPASADLVDGAIVDLNVMSRRGRFRHSVRRITVDGQLRLPPSHGTIIVFCQRGSVQCDAVSLESEDCAVLDSVPSAVELNAAEPAEVLLIELSASE
ncbi:HutD family protein [Steroidobacter sp.]|uniref:HutD/Ves family protein n=1 Tax=Steroidobacter sp. TaxID=1978227 RepID=UPI001A363392|nr:HutD family protein [Steroidobacter sp.]MBL8266545.1 HutD family protein [Steroidobacter sp.]